MPGSLKAQPLAFLPLLCRQLQTLPKRWNTSR